MDIDLSSGLKRAGRADARLLADITAEAFAADPVMNWMFGTPRAIQSAFRTLARELYVPLGACFLHGEVGATMWKPWGADSTPSKFGLVQFAIGQMMYGDKGALKRAMAGADVMEEHHPTERHWYLFTIGTTQAARGKGVGKALLAPILEACDRVGMPLYLENSNPVNSGFYRSQGFERLADPFPLGEGSPVMEPMWRVPKT